MPSCSSFTVDQSPSDWDARFRQQARWTENIRAYLLDRALTKAAYPLRILEVGCGTGVVTQSMAKMIADQYQTPRPASPSSPAKEMDKNFHSNAHIFPASQEYLVPVLGANANTLNDALGYAQIAICGIDISMPFLQMAQRSIFPPSPVTLAQTPKPLPGRISLQYAAADALQLPYPMGSFALVCSHFFLLWMDDPLASVREMMRVTQPGGWVVAFAEPDYGGRVDYPAELAELGHWQTDALRAQGAETNRGRQLSGLFHHAGLENIETGILSGQWRGALSVEEQDAEWVMLQHDLLDKVSPEDINRLRQKDQAAWASGERVLFVPTFYAVGRKSAGMVRQTIQQ